MLHVSYDEFVGRADWLSSRKFLRRLEKILAYLLKKCSIR